MCVCECVCVNILVQEPITEKKDDNMSFSLMEFNAHRATIHILHNTKKMKKKLKKGIFGGKYILYKSISIKIYFKF